ncbi:MULTISPECIES: GtrA family protein [Sphingobacterium]|uniref:GtrA family protein n=1 Tax=Sphingobacterium TaxID=28453 RepID=UPI0006274EF5|nr:MULTISPECIES: GtrA family protein [Sphingobacterium]KKO89637.1 GtrA family protein [Sphingobacterium sp. Ag1]
MAKIITLFLNLFYRLFKKFIPYQLYAYLAVGALNTILNILIFVLSYHFILPKAGLAVAGVHFESYTISLVIAFLITVPTGFWLARTFAFEAGITEKTEGAKKLIKYFIVVLQGLGTDYLIMKTLIVVFRAEPTLAKIISTAITLSINYILQKYFTFVKKK